MIESVKDLEKLLKLCRKQGCQEFTGLGVSFKLNDTPFQQTQTTTYAEEDAEQEPYANFPDGTLTPEELTFFANGGKPEDNPYRQN